MGKFYIIRIADTPDDPADKFVICESVISVNSATPAFAFLEGEFGGTPPIYSATDWDFSAFGVEMDGTVHR